MKKILIFSLLALLSMGGFCQASDSTISIIPEPVSLVRGAGFFTLPENISISIPASPELKETGQLLKQKLAVTRKAVTINGPDKTSIIQLTLNKTVDKTLCIEGYTLSVRSSGILIAANKPAGLFYGIQTLLQLLPGEIESRVPVSGIAWSVPVVEITYYPRFGWRWLMFDVARHFFTKQ